MSLLANREMRSLEQLSKTRPTSRSLIVVVFLTTGFLAGPATSSGTGQLTVTGQEAATPKPRASASPSTIGWTIMRGRHNSVSLITLRARLDAACAVALVAGVRSAS